MNFRTIWEQLRANYANRTQNEQRILLGVGVAIVLALLYLGVWVPITDYRTQVTDEIEHGQETVQRSARFIGAADSLRADREALKKKLATAEKDLLPGNSGTLGAAALQERANAAASAKGVTVQSIQVMKEEEAEPYRKVAIRMTLSSELKPLAELVSLLELSNHLVVPFIEISRRGAVVAGGKAPRTLQATVEVSGFVLASAREAEAAETAPDATPAGESANDDETPPAPPGGAPAPGAAAPPGSPTTPKGSVPPPGVPATPGAAGGSTPTTAGPAAPPAAPTAPSAAMPPPAGPAAPGVPVLPAPAAPDKSIPPPAAPAPGGAQ